MRPHPTYLAICGPGSADDAALVTAYAAGRGAAQRGWIVVTGGLGGAMAAAAEGCAEAGGTSLALLPGTDRDQASPAHTFALPTGLGEMRNALIVRCVDAVLAVAGSWGTLSEIALAARTGTPVAWVGGRDLGVPDDPGAQAPRLFERADQALDWLAEQVT